MRSIRAGVMQNKCGYHWEFFSPKTPIAILLESTDLDGIIARAN
jgi:hypothetical protein